MLYIRAQMFWVQLSIRLSLHAHSIIWFENVEFAMITEQHMFPKRIIIIFVALIKLYTLFVVYLRNKRFFASNSPIETMAFNSSADRFWHISATSTDIFGAEILGLLETFLIKVWFLWRVYRNETDECVWRNQHISCGAADTAKAFLSAMLFSCAQWHAAVKILLL